MTRPCGRPRRQLRCTEPPALREDRERSLEELLAEPIVLALMAADGVDPEELEALLRWSRQTS